MHVRRGELCSSTPSSDAGTGVQMHIRGEALHDEKERLRAIFLAWLKRNGGAKHMTTCEKKLRHLGLDVDSAIGNWDQARISVVLSRGGAVVWLRDLHWADEYATAYDVEVPHHSQCQKKI